MDPKIELLMKIAKLKKQIHLQIFPTKNHEKKKIKIRVLVYVKLNPLDNAN